MHLGAQPRKQLQLTICSHGRIFHLLLERDIGYCYVDDGHIYIFGLALGSTFSHPDAG